MEEEDREVCIYASMFQERQEWCNCAVDGNERRKGRALRECGVGGRRGSGSSTVAQVGGAWGSWKHSLVDGRSCSCEVFAMEGRNGSGSGCEDEDARV